MVIDKTIRFFSLRNCAMGDKRCFPVGLALLHEGAERRYANAGANHQDWRVAVRRQTEVRIILNEDAHCLAFRQAFAEKAGSAADISRLTAAVAHDADAQMRRFADLGLR